MVDQYSFQYLNDWHFLQEAHERALSDRGIYDSPDAINAAFCRLLAIHMVGSVEAILQCYPEILGVENNNNYFRPGMKNLSKINILIDGISTLWSPVDHEIITDFIAIKIIRNGIVHSRDLETNHEFLEKRGFPINPNLLNETHWNRMCEVYREMIRYLIGIS